MPSLELALEIIRSPFLPAHPPLQSALQEGEIGGETSEDDRGDERGRVSRDKDDVQAGQGDGEETRKRGWGGLTAWESGTERSAAAAKPEIGQSSCKMR